MNWIVSNPLNSITFYDWNVSQQMEHLWQLFLPKHLNWYFIRTNMTLSDIDLSYFWSQTVAFTFAWSSGTKYTRRNATKACRIEDENLSFLFIWAGVTVVCHMIDTKHPRNTYVVGNIAIIFCSKCLCSISKEKEILFMEFFFDFFIILVFFFVLLSYTCKRSAHCIGISGFKSYCYNIIVFRIFSFTRIVTTFSVCAV